MAACTVCGKPAGFMMSACDSCLAKQSAADTGGSVTVAGPVATAAPGSDMATVVGAICILGGIVIGCLNILGAITSGNMAAALAVGLATILAGFFCGAVLLTLSRIAQALEHRPD